MGALGNDARHCEVQERNGCVRGFFIKSAPAFVQSSRYFFNSKTRYKRNLYRNFRGRDNHVKIQFGHFFACFCGPFLIGFRSKSESVMFFLKTG